MKQVVTSLFIFIGIAMFIFAALQLTARRRTEINLSLCALFSSFGYIWLYYGIFRLNRLGAFSWLLYSDVPATYLVGPLFLNYTRNIIEKQKTSAKHIFIHCLPAVFALIYLVLFRPAGQVTPSILPGPNPDHFQIAEVRIINAFGDLHFFIYALISFTILVRVRKQADLRLRNHFRTVLLYYSFGLILFIIFFAGHVLSSENILGTAALANGINSIYFFFMSYRYPEYTQKFVPAVSGTGKKAAVLSSIDIPSILSRLDVIMVSDEGFRNPDISVQSLSTHLGIQNHHLSQILKDCLGSNFRSYINRCRLDEAQRLLSKEPDLNILDIAYTVGFNSKSTFNAAFVKDTGITPSNYRKKTQKTS